MDTQIERTERMMAPLPFVWDEMNSLDRLLAKTVHVTDYEILLDGERAQGRTVLAWGPVKKTLSLDVTLLGIVAERQIRYAIEAAGIATRFEATVDLIPFGLNETQLSCRATLEMQHRLAGRLRHVLDEMTEEYVERFIERVKAKSEKRRLAEDRLL